jgi:glycine dehydrogenase
MVSLPRCARTQQKLTNSAYGDMNLFCTCGPVDPVDEAEGQGGITGASAPTPT